MLKLTTLSLFRSLSACVLLVIFIGVNGTSFSQTDPLENQAKVAEYLGDSRFNELLQSNPSYLTFLDTRCSEGYKLIDMPAEKTAGMTVLNSITYEEWVVPEKSQEQVVSTTELTLTPEEFVQEALDPEFNFLKYHFKYDQKEMTYFVLGATGKAIIIYPVEYINKQAN